MRMTTLARVEELESRAAEAEDVAEAILAGHETMRREVLVALVRRLREHQVAMRREIRGVSSRALRPTRR